MAGSDFTPHQEFIKQSIVDAFASSNYIRGDASDKIRNAVESRINKKVNVITTEIGRICNFYYTYNNCPVHFKVKGLIIYLFTNPIRY